MVALGSEHSVAATGLKDATPFKLLLACFMKEMRGLCLFVCLSVSLSLSAFFYCCLIFYQIKVRP